VYITMSTSGGFRGFSSDRARPAVSECAICQACAEGGDRLVGRVRSEAVVPANWGLGFSAMIGGDGKARETTRSAEAGSPVRFTTFGTWSRGQLDTVERGTLKD